MATDKNKNRYNVPALEKAIAIIETLAEQTEPIGVSQICKMLDMPKTSTFFILNTLEAHGYIKKDDVGGYELGTQLLHLGLQLLNRIDIRAIAKEPMEQLLSETKFTVHLAIYDKGEAMYVEKMESNAFVQFSTYIGQKLPLHASGVGKAMAAYLDPAQLDQIIEEKGLTKKTENTFVHKREFLENLELVRKLGYAVEDEEGEYGIRCIGAPIFDHSGQVEAAISITAIRNNLSVQEIPTVGKKVVVAANKISKAIGYMAKTK